MLGGGTPGFFCEIRGPRAILRVGNANIYVAINMQLMYNFAEIIKIEIIYRDISFFL